MAVVVVNAPLTRAVPATRNPLAVVSFGDEVARPPISIMNTLFNAEAWRVTVTVIVPDALFGNAQISALMCVLPFRKTFWLVYPAPFTLSLTPVTPVVARLELMTPTQIMLPAVTGLAKS